jgi:hypothetical protein
VTLPPSTPHGIASALMPISSAVAVAGGGGAGVAHETASCFCFFLHRHFRLAVFCVRVFAARWSGGDCTLGLGCKAGQQLQTVLLCKRASKPYDPLDYDPTTDTTMVC